MLLKTYFANTIDPNSTNYLQIIAKHSTSFASISQILNLNILATSLTQDNFKKNIVWIDTLKRDFTAADNIVNKIADPEQKKILSNINAYFKFLLEAAKNVLQIRFFYYISAK